MSAFEQAMKVAEGVTRLDADIAGMEAEHALVVALRRAGVSTVVRRGDETRMQALERVLTETQRAEDAAAQEAVAEKIGGERDGHGGTGPEDGEAAGRELLEA